MLLAKQWKPRAARAKFQNSDGCNGGLASALDFSHNMAPLQGVVGGGMKRRIVRHFGVVGLHLLIQMVDCGFSKAVE